MKKYNIWSGDIFYKYGGGSILTYTIKQCRVTSLEQLSVAEFSGEKARPKVYENCQKNVPMIWLDLVSIVKIWAHF